MTGKAGAPLTEAMFYVLMALRRGRAVRHGDRRMDGAVYGGAGPSGAGDAVYHLGAFSGGGLHSGDVGAGTAAELSADGEGAAGVPE